MEHGRSVRFQQRLDRVGPVDLALLRRAAGDHPTVLSDVEAHRGTLQRHFAAQERVVPTRVDEIDLKQRVGDRNRLARIGLGKGTPRGQREERDATEKHALEEGSLHTLTHVVHRLLLQRPDGVERLDRAKHGVELLVESLCLRLLVGIASLVKLSRQAGDRLDPFAKFREIVF